MVKLSKITNLSDDIALALGATGVRIAPIPDKISVVGIEVPNKQVTPVLIRDVIESREFGAQVQDRLCPGRDIGGQKYHRGKHRKMPHVLIAGTTGSGKSVCTNSLIISLLYKSTPDEVRFIMVDPKMVELAPYNGIPHLLIPVVTDPKKAAGALQWAVFEMMKRYKTFSECGVKKLEEFNKLARASSEDGSGDHAQRGGGHRRVGGSDAGGGQGSGGIHLPGGPDGPCRRRASGDRHPASFGRRHHWSHEGQHPQPDRLRRGLLAGVPHHSGYHRRRKAGGQG